ncbi:uncharacterized protein LOC119267568 isoform X1 [Triticum dicoccoides]|uniref:uncharacterized protein LOC119267568 isoform X1 n=1 Tax=Triticum dicoccoides TaxID=85692 RepID=UPI00188DE0F6|nr:uncharacterized protein LOC119267568 isoform X1 [Triticum dicoccoides]XP_044339432.1 uncharacterized protein LOC123060682 isoform X2 [Triticum aestivum]
MGEAPNRRHVAHPTGIRHFSHPLSDDGMMLLLFETPSGFAIFSFRASVIEEPNALEKIWTHFILNGTAKSKITCVCDPTVMELMWGIQIRMPSLVPKETSGPTEDDHLPMSQGLRKVLRDYGCDYVNPEMLDQPILLTACALFECDSLEDEKSEELSHLAKLIKVVSGINTEGWDSLKIATALKKIWCPEEAANSCEIISEGDVSRLVNDADKYKVKLEKDACLELSREIMKSRGVRASKEKVLQKYAEQAKKAYEAQKLINH